MHKLMDYICDELKEMEKKAEKGDLSKTDIQYMDTLAHAGKNLSKIMDYCGEGSYSNYSNYSGYSRRSSYRGGSYGDGGSYNSYRDEAQSFVRPDGSYNHDMYSERGRDSMGRYSRSEGLKHELYRLMDDAPDERTRKELEKLIDKM